VCALVCSISSFVFAYTPSGCMNSGSAAPLPPVQSVLKLPQHVCVLVCSISSTLANLGVFPVNRKKWPTFPSLITQ
jgi:hypothetical protein